MSLEAGVRLGPYEIVSPLGAGGMGEVYKALDTASIAPWRSRSCRPRWRRGFPPSDARWQISVDGGTNPLWPSDGKELFFLSPDNHMMSAVVTINNGTFDAGVAKPLFQTPPIRRGSRSIVAGDRFYAVTPKGDRFLINRVTSDVRTSVITIILDR